MGDIKLFKMAANQVQELDGRSMMLEKSLQVLIERHLDILLGIEFLASEYSTGRIHAGRIDTLGIDENGCPVIIEYKRASNENVISQGLFYLDWLMDHKAEFELLVLKQLGQPRANAIEWSSPRLICIAGDFTKYDQHAVQQIHRNIELIRYRSYAQELILLELVNVTSTDGGKTATSSSRDSSATYKGVTEYLADAGSELADLYEALKQFLLSLGDDVSMKTLKYWFAFRRIKNFACVEVHAKSEKLLVFVKVNPDDVRLEEGFTRDVRKIGHYGTGDLEITLRTPADLEKAKPMIEESYEVS